MKNNLPLIPTNIIEAISYSPGSIVSKIIYHRHKLQITLFSVAKGESIKEHTTSREAIVHILEGKGKFYLRNKWHAFGSGSYFYLPPNLIHAIKAQTNFKFLLYLLN